MPVLASRIAPSGSLPFAALFPGQLSEKPGMGEALALRYDFCAAFFEEVSRRSGVDLGRTFFGPGAPSLHDDLPAQVGVFAVSLAALDALGRAHGLAPAAVAGYSLGTYAALVAAGCLDRWGALDVLLEAERLLAEGKSAGDFEGTMGFVIGLSRPEVERGLADVCPDVSRLSIATENAAAQFVLTGETDLIKAAVDALRPRALRAEMLPIGFPMHSRSLSSVCDGLQRFLEGGVRVKQPRTALYAPMLARQVKTAEDAAHVLSKQISLPSLFATTLQCMSEAGLHRYAEVGPGDVLTRLLRWTLREAQGHVVESPETAAAFAGVAASVAAAAPAAPEAASRA